ncbi:hypothetical protein, partial [Azospirillum sp. INR13]|uniref:hypothetical protein n=1 Tax=Azospirillum sp. INR13 TaxID=2596919 RepID=UPI00189257C5
DRGQRGDGHGDGLVQPGGVEAHRQVSQAKTAKDIADTGVPMLLRIDSRRDRSLRKICRKWS